MARTKQTARKATGAPAKRFSLAPKTPQEKVVNRKSKERRQRTRTPEAEDLRKLHKTIKAAASNPYYLPWDAAEFAAASYKSTKRFPPQDFGLLDKPAIVVDCQGRIVLWYLPGLLLPPRQLELINAARHLEPIIKKNIKTSNGNLKPSWRVDSKYFIESTPSQTFAPGVENYSAGWLAQAHTSQKYKLKPSRSLQIKRAQDWMTDSAQGIKLVNKAMELIHPRLFASALAVRDELRKEALTKELASKWESAFTAISVIVNRTSIEHRDYSGEPGWYDFLISLGNYSFTTLKFPELGVEMIYNPGTTVAFCGNAFKHGVPDWGRGDRICYALFNKKVVLKRFGQDKAGWMTLSDFKQ